jgi:hypothetical protein
MGWNKMKIYLMAASMQSNPSPFFVVYKATVYKPMIPAYLTGIIQQSNLLCLTGITHTGRNRINTA